MKTFLFNGCSFVAGDAIVWDEYLEQKGIPYYEFSGWLFKKDSKLTQEEMSNLYSEYRNEFRTTRNLPAMVAAKCNAKLIDISQDGNSNDSISMTTILKILDMSTEEKENLHVVIGWTESARRLRYIKEEDAFFNLHSNHYDQRHTNKKIQGLLGYLTHGIIMTDDRNHYLNYVRNIMLLENFLKSNNITYTFYRSLGTPFDCMYHSLNCLFFLEGNRKNLEDKAKFTDDRFWYKFNDTDPWLAFEGSSVVNEYMWNDPTTRIDETNGHPNKKLAAKIANNLAYFIKNQLGLSDSN